MPAPLKRGVFKLGNSIFSLPQRARRTKPTSQEILDDQTYQELMEIFMPDIEQLEVLLEHDLSTWYKKL